MNVEKTGSGKVAEYYESVENRLWDLLTEGHIHLGYWNRADRDSSFLEGTHELTQLMIRLANIAEGQRFCDIGCGVGVPAVWLAQAKGCRVDGITISPYQQKEAVERAKRAGVNERVSFWKADALDLPFADASFDGGWFFESIFHMGHRPALQEAHRILKPGSELLLADVVDIGALTEEDKRLAKELCNAAYIPADSYSALLQSTGFELMELTDCTQEVMGPFEAKFVKAVRERRQELLSIADESILEAFENVAAQLVRTAGYVIVKARRM